MRGCSQPPPDPEGSVTKVVNATALRIVDFGVLVGVVLAKRERRGSGRAAGAKVIVEPNCSTAAGEAGPGVETIFAGLGLVE